MRSKVWRNRKKYSKRQYIGSYQRNRSNERNFILSYIFKNGKSHNISFESWQMAKEIGWRKLKTKLNKRKASRSR